MRREGTTLVWVRIALFTCLAFPSFSFGQMETPDQTEERRFGRYVDSHPLIARDLQNNPNLINDPKWVNNHPGVGKYLNNHPGIRQQLSQDPSHVLNRAGGTNSQPQPQPARRDRRPSNSRH